MTISGNPKKLVQDIAAGFFSLSPTVLKKYSPADLRIIQAHIQLVKQDIRQLQVPREDVQLVKARNMQLSRINHAETVLKSYCKKMRIVL